MGEQRDHAVPCVKPVTTTDMLLAQMIGLLGEIRLSLSQEATQPVVVTEPKKPARQATKKKPVTGS